MIIEKGTVKSLAGKSWDEVYQTVQDMHKEHSSQSLFHDLLDPVFDFCAYTTGLMHSMQEHAYKMTETQAFMWLYVSSYVWQAKHEQYTAETPAVKQQRATLCAQFEALLVPEDYKPLDSDKVRSLLHQLFEQNAFTTPTMAAVLWTAYLQTGTERKAKPQFSAYTVFPYLARVMPPFYRKDIGRVETVARDTIFMILPNLLGKFSTDWQTVQSDS